MTKSGCRQGMGAGRVDDNEDRDGLSNVEPISQKMVPGTSLF